MMNINDDNNNNNKVGPANRYEQLCGRLGGAHTDND